MRRRIFDKNLYVHSFVKLLIVFKACKAISDSNNPKFITDSLIAHFYYFVYIGIDYYYKENPLQGDDYFYNPILPGWYSDSSICTNGKDFFLVASTFSYYQRTLIFHCTDLVNWKQIGHVLNRPEQLPREGRRVNQWIFAPAMSFNPQNQTYYIITTNIRRGGFIVKTKAPFESWSNPIWLPNVGGIDPSLFFDEDSKAYKVNNDVPDGGSTYNGHHAIRIIEFDIETDATIGESKMLINDGVDLAQKPVCIEGPHLYKISGQYFLMCAEGRSRVDHREFIFNGYSPFRDFYSWEGNPILRQNHIDDTKGLPVACTGHADLIKKGNGKWWSLFWACRPIDNKFENLDRETFNMPVNWSKDGYPYMTRGNEVVPRIIQMKGDKRKNEVTNRDFDKRGDYDTQKLALEWITFRGTATDLYSLTENPGYLTLKCADAVSNELKSSAFVCRCLQHHKFEYPTNMDFSPQSENESAGMLLMKDETHQYMLVVENEWVQSKVSHKKHFSAKTETIDSELIDKLNNPVQLKIDSNGHKFSFFCAIENSNWKLLTDKVDTT